MDADESLSSGHSTPIQSNVEGGNESQRALEPGLTSKPPIPPAGNVQEETAFDREQPKSAVTFDDAIELKFQRWFPNSAPVVTPSATDVSLNGMSYEYSERVIDKDKGTITYTRSSSSMSIRGSQDQLDEEHLYSNLSAAFNGEKLKASVSVDLLEILQNDDNRRVPSAKSKKKKKAVPNTLRVKKDPQKSVELKKSVLKSKPTRVDANEVTRNEQSATEKEVKRELLMRTTSSSPVDHGKEDVVSWMSSHQRASTPEFNDTFVSVFGNQNHNKPNVLFFYLKFNKTSIYCV